MLEDFRLKVFVTVAEKGSFTLAAKELGVSQPAVSQNISELEKSVGSELVRRGRGAVSLTPEGASFIEYARAILHWYDAAGSLFGESGRMTGNRPVRVAADPVCTSAVVPALVSNIVSASSRLSFQILPSDASEYDIALDSELDVEPMSIDKSATYVFSLRAAAMASDPTLADVSDLSKLPEGTKLAVVAPYSQALPLDQKAAVAIEAQSPEAVVKAVELSQGMVGLVPQRSVPAGMTVLPVALPNLGLRVHLKPSAAFEGTQVCKYISSVLRNLVW